MWIGELITKRGIGNGISLLIFASILTSAPQGINAWLNGGAVEKLFFPLIAIGIVVAVVFVQEGQRRIPIQYAKRMVGRRQTAGRRDLHAAAREHGRRDPGHLRGRAARAPADGRVVRAVDVRRGSTRTSRRRRGRTSLVEAVLIIVFTYFYTAVQFNPVDQADNLRKYGGYIPGIRPGPADRAVPRPRADAADAARARCSSPSSPCCRRSSSTHFGFSQATSRALGGTSVLIVVGVALDTMRQMESQMMMRSYEGFLR